MKLQKRAVKDLAKFYDDKYDFVNAECNEHIKRYLKKNIDEFPEHKLRRKCANY